MFVIFFVYNITGVAGADGGSTQNVFGSWNSAMLTGNFGGLSPASERWRWLIMDQNRTRDDSRAGTRFSENLLWVQLGYQVHKNVGVWLGYTHAWIDPLDKPSFQESRPYQDLLVEVPLLEGKFLSRTRIEQRVTQSSGSVGIRSREWIQFSYPLTFLSDQIGFYFGDEVLFYLNDSSFGRSGFSENRVLGGFNFSFSVHWSAEVGYLGQYVVNPTGRDLFTHNLMTNIRYRF